VWFSWRIGPLGTCLDRGSLAEKPGDRVRDEYSKATVCRDSQWFKKAWESGSNKVEWKVSATKTFV
jgi:hypothetical protein